MEILTNNLIMLPILFLALFGTVQLILRFRWTLIIAALLTVLLSFFWNSLEFMDLFRWIKVYSVIIGITYFGYITTKKGQIKPYEKNIVYAIFAINIFEAVVTDFQHNTTFGYANAILGTLLLATMALPRSIAKSKIGKLKLLDWKQMELPWILCYTAWNLLFVLNTYPEFIFNHLILLSVPLTFQLIYKAGWMHARSISLFGYLIISFTGNQFMSQFNTALLVNNFPLKIFLLSIGILTLTINTINIVKSKTHMSYEKL